MRSTKDNIGKREMKQERKASKIRKQKPKQIYNLHIYHHHWT